MSLWYCYCTYNNGLMVANTWAQTTHTFINWNNIENIYHNIGNKYCRSNDVTSYYSDLVFSEQINFEDLDSSINDYIFMIIFYEICIILFYLYSHQQRLLIIIYIYTCIIYLIRWFLLWLFCDSDYARYYLSYLVQDFLCIFQQAC